jgi:hypothetical protein
MSDALLLPSLLREATRKSRLGYQVVPGYAEATEIDVPELDLLAARVAFVADGDQGGAEHAQKLLRAGVKSWQIKYLGGAGSGLSVEDVLVKDVYVEAINDELGRWYRGVKVLPTDVPDVGRARAVEQLLAGRRDADGRKVKLGKTAVAQRVLERRLERALLSPTRRTTLRALDGHLETALSKASFAP